MGEARRDLSRSSDTRLNSAQLLFRAPAASMTSNTNSKLRCIMILIFSAGDESQAGSNEGSSP